MDNLNSIGGSLVIEANPALLSLTGLETLTFIGGDLSVGYLFGYYGGNASLTSLAGLENISVDSISNLVIGYNQSLSTCDIQSICDYMVSPNGTVSILHNAPGCNSQAEVEDSCMVGVPAVSCPQLAISSYPNPFTGHITINYTLEESEHITLEILNPLGQVIENLTNGILTPGSHQVSWNTEGLPAGIYYCRLQAGDQMASTKINKIQ
ncbi:MAG: T9SS type A sorting domain-containing protein [Bacteroidales bacterium]